MLLFFTHSIIFLKLQRTGFSTLYQTKMKCFFQAGKFNAKIVFYLNVINNVFLQAKAFSAMTCIEKNEELLTLCCCSDMNLGAGF